MRGKFTPTEIVTIVLAVVIIVAMVAGVLLYGMKPISECPVWVLFVLGYVLVTRGRRDG